MAGEWREVSLGDVSELVRGVSYRPNDLLSDGLNAVPLLRATNIGEGILDLSNVLHVPSTLVREAQYLRRFDVVLAMSSGSRQAVGRLAQLRRDWTGCVGAFCGVIRPNPQRIHPEYLGYVLHSPDFRTRIETYAVGTAIMNLSRERLLGFRFRLPGPAEQRAIAHILGTLDDKIELLRRMSETLEEMARAIFKSWFVDFDPVHAKAAVRREHPNWTNEQVSRAACPNLKPEIAELFQDAFEDSELGEIPKGWKIQSFTDEVEVIGGGTPTTSVPEYWGGEIPWFSVVDTPAPGEVFVVSTQKTITTEGLNSSSARILPVGTTIISARGTVGNLALVGVPMAMNQSCYGLRPRHGRRGYYVYFATAALVEILRQRAHGSVFSTITRETLGGTQVVAPPCDLMQTFERVVDGLLKRVLANQHQSRTLAAIRDALLPKLISGELRVPDAERIVARTL